MRPFLYGPRYVIDHQLLGKTRPLICGLVLTNRCNLQCRHCKLATRGQKDLSFDAISVAVDSFYQEGGRCLYLQGGEPFVWHDRRYRLDDVVDYPHGLGFLTVVTYTNGALPIHTSADTAFVSVDGVLAENAHPFDDQPIRIDHPQASFMLTRCSSGGRDFSASTVRGAKGGHTLCEPPDRISLREIYHVFEGTEGFVECRTSPELCERTDGCVTQEV